jgi:hypothetical protein
MRLGWLDNERKSFVILLDEDIYKFWLENVFELYKLFKLDFFINVDKLLLLILLILLFF